VNHHVLDPPRSADRRRTARSTPRKRALLDLLAATDAFQTATQIHAALRERRYRLRRDDRHHHYLLCRICGRAVEVISEPIEQWASTIGGGLGFSDVSHTVSSSATATTACAARL
jgi:Fe2+ or Zn2+ uptake regulation protein